MTPEKMICIRCDGEDFETKVQAIDQILHGFDIRVESEAQTCKNCGWFTLSLSQADVIISKCKDEWIEKAETEIVQYKQAK